MSLTRLLPDAVGVVIDHLNAASEVTDLVGSSIGSRLPATPTYPFVVVQRLGGTPVVPRWADRPILQVDVYAAGEDGAWEEEPAWEAMETVRQDIDAMKGETVSGAVVIDVQELLGPQQLAEATGRPRWTFRTEVRMRPAE